MIFRLRGSNIRLKCPTVIISEYILNFSSSKMITCTFFEVFLKLHFFKEIKSNYFDILLLLSLRLHVMLKPLLWAFFSLFLLPSTVFGWTGKRFLSVFDLSLPRTRVTSIGPVSLYTRQIFCYLSVHCHSRSV